MANYTENARKNVNIQGGLWRRPVIPALGGWRLEHQKFKFFILSCNVEYEASLGYLRLRLKNEHTQNKKQPNKSEHPVIADKQINIISCTRCV